jgi:hypothetical protein
MTEPARGPATQIAAPSNAAGVAQRKFTPPPFPSFPFTLMKVAAFQLVMLLFVLLGYAQIGTGAWPRIAAECMAFLRGSGLLPLNKN